jgi:glycosyltransferase involved in cell wall biosynthesis
MRLNRNPARAKWRPARAEQDSRRRVRHKVAIVHDYLTQRGGAERVVLAMLAAFPEAPVLTALYEPDSTFPEFASHDVRPLWTNAIGPLRSDHRRGLMLYPLAFSRTMVDAEVTLCSSSGFAHGVRTTGRKVVYCHTPARWLYDEASAYIAGRPRPARLVLALLAPSLRRWDRRAAASASAYLTNSTVARERIAREYGIDAIVLPPPLQSRGVAAPERAVAGFKPGFVLCVSRLLAYKNVDVVVKAFADLPERLVVVGDGPERAGIERGAGPNVTFLGTVGDANLAWLYANCSGLVSAAREDFGLTPLEAAAAGKPAAVLRFGGFLDTVVQGETGVFFDAPEPHAVREALTAMLSRSWEPSVLVKHADLYGEQVFADGLRAAIVESQGAGRH